MQRVAEYTIKGFLYQFNKSLLTILESSRDAVVTVEGIDEDIELVEHGQLTAIQCKYHEAIETFTLSSVYEPILQMMNHFVEHKADGRSYVIYAHYNGWEASHGSAVTIEMLDTVLRTDNRQLQKYCTALTGIIDLGAFLQRFRIEFGPSLDELTAQVCSRLQPEGFTSTEVETLVYPNAIHLISLRSIQHVEDNRRISKSEMIRELKGIKKTAITHWTLALKSRKLILESRRKQLKYHLDINSRNRYFIANSRYLDDFKANIVSFICDYISKYHHKPSHICTPLFCIDCTRAELDGIQYRLHQKGIISTDDYIGGVFDKEHFFREPMMRRHLYRNVEWEFAIRLTTWSDHRDVIVSKKPDDLFLLGECDLSRLDCRDVEIEILGSQSFPEIQYLMGVSNVYE